jgi:AcrR family transcriptional regulator
MTSFRRTRSAILEGAKSLVVLHGVSQTSMIEISAAAEVSRATLYNHFRDKDSVFRALLEGELTRILELAATEPSLSERLVTLSRAISSDPALATMRNKDAALLTALSSNTTNALWERTCEAIFAMFAGSDVGGTAIIWLVGQVFHPLDEATSAFQAAGLARLGSE